MLTTIRNLSFEFKENSKEIVLVHNTLANLIETLNQARTRESGIPILPVHIKSPGPSKRHIPIPVCKSTKLPSDRVGSHKDKITAALKIFLMEKSDIKNISNRSLLFKELKRFQCLTAREVNEMGKKN